MVRCSSIPATCKAGHQRIALSSASSMQSWTGYDSSLDFVADEYCAMQSPSLSSSENTSNPPPYSEAEKLRAVGDHTGYRVFKLLGAIASFHPNYDASGNPYGPLWRERTQRSLMAEDLNDLQLKTLQEILPEIRDVEFRA